MENLRAEKVFSYHRQHELYELFEQMWLRKITFGVLLTELKRIFKFKGDYELINVDDRFRLLMRLEIAEAVVLDEKAIADIDKQVLKLENWRAKQEKLSKGGGAR